MSTPTTATADVGGRLHAGLGVRCVDLVHTYSVDGADVPALRGLNVDVHPGESVALFGASGSGKSTLMVLLAGLRRPTSGQIYLGGDDIARMSERDLLMLRGQRIGVVVQQPSRNLLPYGTVADNVRFAQSGVRRSRRRTLPEPVDLLRRLGLAALTDRAVGRLSGGEQQRVSVALGMANAPGLLLADEPTSQLDTTSRDSVVELLRHIAGEFGTTVVAVTHDAEVAAALGRVVTIRDGHADDHDQHVEQFVDVDEHGTVVLPPDIARRHPAGARARIVRKAGGIELVFEPEEPT